MNAAAGRRLAPALLVAALALGACSATAPVSEWRDEAFAGGPFGDLLVIAIDDDDLERRLFEDSFARALRAERMTATPSWGVMPTDEKVDKVLVRNAIAGRSIDAVLVVHLVGTEEREIYHPPRSSYAPARYSQRYYGYYSSVYDYVYEPGYYTRHNLVKLETNLYDVASEELIWSSQSETLDPESANGLIESLAVTVIDQLRAQRLLASPG